LSTATPPDDASSISMYSSNDVMGATTSATSTARVGAGAVAADAVGGPESDGEAAAGGRPTAASVMAGAAAGVARRRLGDATTPGRGGDAIRRARPAVRAGREGRAGMKAIGFVGGRVVGGGGVPGQEGGRKRETDGGDRGR